MHSAKIEVDQKGDQTALQGERDPLEGVHFPVGHWCNPSFLSSFRDMALPFAAVMGRWLNKLTGQVACKGLITESLRSTSISSFVTPDCICVWIPSAYQLVNWLNYKQKRVVNQKKRAIVDRIKTGRTFSKNTRTRTFPKLFCFRLLNFANTLKSRKSRNLILAKISEDKVHRQNCLFCTLQR